MFFSPFLISPRFALLTCSSDPRTNTVLCWAISFTNMDFYNILMAIDSHWPPLLLDRLLWLLNLAGCFELHLFFLTSDYNCVHVLIFVRCKICGKIYVSQLLQSFSMNFNCCVLVHVHLRSNKWFYYNYSWKGETIISDVMYQSGSIYW